MATPTFLELAKWTEDEARGYIESLRWPNGPVCPRCGSVKTYRLIPKEGSKHPGRPGLLKCGDCRKQFTVTVGTIFEDSHIPLAKWLLAIHLMCSSKKGISAHQLHRELGMTYKSAWFMAHRVRYAMTQSPLADKLSGVVEADEAYVGGKPRKGTGPHKRGLGTEKTPIVSLVERGGNVRSFKVPRVNEANLRSILTEHISPDARLMTDDSPLYHKIGGFADHQTVNHTAGEYARDDAHINTAEAHFSLVKRGVYGTYHHWGRQHLDRYLQEFDFRWNTRQETDGERTALAVMGGEGKRLARVGQ